MGTLPTLSDQLTLVEWLRRDGFFVDLSLTAAEALVLTEDDLDALRALGLTEAMLADVRAQAREAPADRIFLLDFAHQTVTIEAPR